PGLVWIQHEDVAFLKWTRTALDEPDAGIAILDWRREFARLERRPHSLVFARGHAAVEDQRLGAAADATEYRADDHIIVTGPREVFVADLAPAGLDDPEGSRISHSAAPASNRSILPRSTIHWFFLTVVALELLSATQYAMKAAATFAAVLVLVRTFVGRHHPF